MTGSKTGRLTTKDEVLQALAARPDAHELPGIVLRHRDAQGDRDVRVVSLSRFKIAGWTFAV